jgi:hypothetical protein
MAFAWSVKRAGLRMFDGKLKELAEKWGQKDNTGTAF